MSRYSSTGRWAFVVAVALFSSIASSLSAADFAITEFAARNELGLRDEHGEASDWIEIANVSDGVASLEGWYLTDDASDLTLWRFPAVALAPGQYLVVFASGRDQRDPSRELHTSFRLSEEGEFLALVEPDGATVATAFSPRFPPQFRDVSYGLLETRETFDLISEGAAAKWIVPSASVPIGWRTNAFGDSSWAAGETGIGFDDDGAYEGLIATDIGSEMRGVNASAFVRIPFDVPNPAAISSLRLRMKFDDGFVAWINGNELARANAPANPAYNSAATAEHGEPRSGRLEETFEATTGDYVLTAHNVDAPPRVRTGGPTGRYLELLRDNTGDLINTVGFPRVFGPSEVVNARFDFRMPDESGHTGCCSERADGFGFALLDTSRWGSQGPGPIAENIVWERPRFPDAFTVGFDIFDGSGQENTVSINWNGVEIAARRVSEFPLNAGVFHRCEVEIEGAGADSFATVRITPDVHGGGTPVTIFDRVRVTGMAGFDSRIAFGGRTGGAFVAVDLDNIEVDFSTSTSQVIEFEDYDISGASVLLEPGRNILAIQALNRTAGDGDLLVYPILEGFGSGGVDPTQKRFFPEPSPGLPNSGGVRGASLTPRFSRAPGAFTSAFDLVLTPSTPGATIRYTTNRTEPTASSPVYSGPIRISTTTIVKAKAFEPDLLPSATITHGYIQVASNTSGFSSDLPIVLVDTFRQGITDSAQTSVWAFFIDTEADGRARMLGATDFQGSAGMKRRGSSSLGFPKPQWSFEAWDDLGNDRNVTILGFPEESDYVFHAPYSDKSLMRNYLAYQWSNEIGRYAVRTRFVEVFLNSGTGALDSSDYLGVYVFMEKIKRDEARVDIAEIGRADVEEPEISGGYIFKKDRLDPGDAGFTTSRGQHLAWVEPKESEVTPQQSTWLRNYLNAFEAALYGPNFRHPELGYAKYIDPDSFIDHHILVELTKNIDGFRLSTFFHKDRGDRLKAGPIWDYNLSLGNADYLEGWIPSGWYNRLISSGDYPWYGRLFEDPEFRQRYADRWTELRADTFRTSKLLADIDAAAAIIEEAQARNFSRWQILGTYVWPNWFIANTWQQELAWMKDWLSSRVDWIDSTFIRPPVFDRASGLVDPGTEVHIVASQGTVWYTTDGTDPRLPGGDVSPSAQSVGEASAVRLVASGVSPEVRVLVPTSGTLGTSWRSVGFDDSDWIIGRNGIGVGYERGSGYETHIDVDVEDDMAGVGTSAYIRVPFEVEDPDEIVGLVLRMRYDDGFVAFLNGVEIARANAPSSLSWSSAATGLHDDAAAVQFDSHDVSAHLGALRAGLNVLAIHGLNDSVTSSDFLIEPELLGSLAFEGSGISIDGPVHIIARASTGDAVWSGPSVASYVTEPDLPLRISEIHYHPAALEEGSPYDEEDLEFIELANLSSGPIHLAGVKLEEGIRFTFADTIVPGGGFVVLVHDREAFEWFWGDAIPVVGEYSGNLSNAGERIRLVNGAGNVIHDFTFEDDWVPETDGVGFSLVASDLFADPEEWGSPGFWRRSEEIDGSPGRGEGGASSSGRRRPGDSNGDAGVDLSDAVHLLRLLFDGSGIELPCGGTFADPANVIVLDVNGDESTDLADAISLLSWLFTSGPPPARGTSCIAIEGCTNACL